MERNVAWDRIQTVKEMEISLQFLIRRKGRNRQGFALPSLIHFLSALFLSLFLLHYSCPLSERSLLPGDKSARTKYQTERVPDFGLEVIPPTCFADPVYVAVEFPLQLLLTAEFQEGLPILDPLPLLGEFSATLKDERISAKKCPCPLSRF